MSLFKGEENEPQQRIPGIYLAGESWTVPSGPQEAEKPEKKESCFRPDEGGHAPRPGHLEGIRQRLSKLRDKYLRSDRDLSLKLRSARLFAELGYVPYLEVPVATHAYREKYKRYPVSDIDVLAIKFDHDLAERSVVIECKSGDERSVEYVLKLDGIVKLRSADQGLLIQTRIPEHARQVAISLGHSTWDEAELRLMLQNFGLGEPSQLEQVIDCHIMRQEVRKRAKRDVPSLASFLYEEYWISPDHRNIHSLIAALRRIPSDDEEARCLLLDETAGLFILATLRAARYIIKHRLSDPASALKDFLFGGPRERREREILFERINRQLGETREGFLPPYFGPLAEIVTRLALASRDSSRLLNVWHTLSNRRLASAGKWLEDVDSIPVTQLKLLKDLLAFLGSQLEEVPEHWRALLRH